MWEIHRLNVWRSYSSAADTQAQIWDLSLNLYNSAANESPCLRNHQGAGLCRWATENWKKIWEKVWNNPPEMPNPTKPWKNIGKNMGKIWKIMKNPPEKYWKILGKHGKNHEKSSRNHHRSVWNPGLCKTQGSFESPVVQPKFHSLRIILFP